MFTLEIKWTTSNTHFYYPSPPTLTTVPPTRFPLPSSQALLSPRVIVRHCEASRVPKLHVVVVDASLDYVFLHIHFITTWPLYQLWMSSALIPAFYILYLCTPREGTKASALANKGRIAISTDASKKIIIMQIGQNNRNGIHYLLGIPRFFELGYEANKMIPFPMPSNYAYGSFMF